MTKVIITSSKLIKKHRGAYASWECMKARCLKVNAIDYKYYGGRGIKICDRWRCSFQNFLDDMGDRPDGLTLDRIDNEGDYTPENCRWVSMKEQVRNRKVSRIITYNGITQCLSDWSDQTGISRSCLGHRLRNGWSEEDAVSTPVKRIKKYGAR